MSRRYYRRYGYGRRYRHYRHYNRRHRRNTLRSATRTAETIARFGGRVGYGAFKFGAKAASYAIVTAARTGAGVVRALIGR
jgi:hypothetical protein